MQSPRVVALAASLLFSLAAMVVAYALADGYIDRLPNHRGYFLVPVDNEVEQAPLVLPKRTVVIVVDGLGYQSAAGMAVARRMAKEGQCRAMSTGELTISRPVYTILSTGVEAARSGSRNNDETTPVVVQSIWELAHKAGMRVHAASDLLWWQQLFPGAFDLYVHEPDTDRNLFDMVELGDLTLVHPSRVDTAGHRFGAASVQYKQAVETTDREVEAFLRGLDLDKDLVIFSADHGHSATGGHGGPGKQLSQVMTCFAGPGVAKVANAEPIDARMIAPLLSVLLGLPFPKHMRALEDSLDQIWTLVDELQLGQSYIQERRVHIEQFRVANGEQLGRWLGQEHGSWSELYQRGHRKHLLWWLGFAALAIVSLALSFRLRGYGLKRALASVLWMIGVMAGVCLLYTWWRGSFDFTSINRRQEYLEAAFAVCGSVLLLGLAVQVAAWRDLRATLADLITLVALIEAIGLMHPIIYGAPLGFPLPGRIALFIPFLHGPLVVSMGLMACALALALLGVEFYAHLTRTRPGLG